MTPPPPLSLQTAHSFSFHGTPFPQYHQANPLAACRPSHLTIVPHPRPFAPTSAGQALYAGVMRCAGPIVNSVGGFGHKWAGSKTGNITIEESIVYLRPFFRPKQGGGDGLNRTFGRPKVRRADKYAEPTGTPNPRYGLIR